MQTSHHYSELTQSNIYYRDLLIDLGVPGDLLTDDLDWDLLYQKLRIPLKSKDPLICTAPWQLQILGNKNFDYTSFEYTDLHDNLGANSTYYVAWSGNLQALIWIKENYPHLLEQKDNKGLTPFHYAAWSGNPQVFFWIKENYPELLEQKNNYGSTPIHFAAESGNLRGLIWLKENYPQLLEQKNNGDATPIHCAAGSGNPQILDWIKENYPQLLKQKNNDDGSITIHYAALSGNPQALIWTKENYPELLEQKNNYGSTPIHYAAWSGNPLALHQALSLSKNPETWTLLNFTNKATDIITNTLLKALEINYTLLTVDFNRCRINTNIKKEIELRLQRNLDIKLCKPKYRTFMQGYDDNASLVSLLKGVKTDVGKNIFTLMLPKKVNAEQVWMEFIASIQKDIAYSLKLIEETIEYLTPSKKENNNLFGLFPSYGFQNNSDKKIDALKALQQMIIANHGNLAKEVADWQAKHSKTIAEHRNLFSEFFSKDETKTELCVQNVKSLLVL